MTVNYTFQKGSVNPPQSLLFMLPISPWSSYPPSEPWAKSEGAWLSPARGPVPLLHMDRPSLQRAEERPRNPY